MRVRFRIIALTLTIAFLAACSPARTGVVGDTLTTNVRPALSIIPYPPLTLATSGRAWAAPKNDDIAPLTSARFDYAVYTDPSVAPIEKLAYAAIIRLEDPVNWMFQPQGYELPGQFGGVKPSLPEGREGKIYTLRVSSERDWASELLRENGQNPPATWLAIRWIFSLESGARAMAEYREPWPENLEAPSSGVLHNSYTGYLRDFEKRALNAFSFEKTLGDFTGIVQAEPKWTPPRVGPDIARMVGDIMRITFGDDSSSFD